MEKIPDEVYIANWRGLLSIFHKINRKSEGAREKFIALIEMAKTKDLTPRQLSGITDRSNYQIHLIDNPEETPFSNMERKEERNTYQLTQANSNGKQ